MTTSGMHRRPSEGRHLVFPSIFCKTTKIGYPLPLTYRRDGLGNCLMIPFQYEIEWALMGTMSSKGLMQYFYVLCVK